MIMKFPDQLFGRPQAVVVQINDYESFDLFNPQS